MLSQCLFGEHLLPLCPELPVALVEAEKTAVICSAVFPEFLWLATGGLDQFNDRVKVLLGRKVIATQHRNTEYPHFHILVNRVLADGHVYKTGFERSRSVKACRAITEMYGLTMGEGRSNINEHALKEPDRSRQMFYREISHALKYSNSSREFWNRLRSAGVDAHPKFKNGKVVGYSFKIDGTCRMSSGKISRDFTRGNLMNVLREKDQSVSERPRLTLVIPRLNENEIGLARHMDEDFSVNFDDFGVNNTLPDFFPEFNAPLDAPSMEQDIRKKEEERKRRRRGMRM